MKIGGRVHIRKGRNKFMKSNIQLRRLEGKEQQQK